jgi:hypothetical protein
MNNKEINFIKYMGMILLVTLGISVTWNILCILGFLPLKSYNVTYVFVLIPSILIILRTLLFQTKDTTTYILNVKNKGKVPAIICICLSVFWVITLIACLVYY